MLIRNPLIGRRMRPEKSSNREKIFLSSRVMPLNGPKEREQTVPKTSTDNVTRAAPFLRDKPNSSVTYAVATS